MKKKLLLMVISLFLVSCSCKRNIQNTEINNKNTEKENIDDNSVKIYNSTKEYLLVVRKKNNRKNNPFPTVSFSIIDVSNQKVIHEDIIPGGKINWISDYKIEVQSMVSRPRDVHSNNKYNVLYIFDVKKNQKSASR